MTKATVKKIISDKPHTRRIVLDILKMFEGESSTDIIETLDVVKYYVTTNCYLDVNLAEDYIIADSATGDDDAEL